MKMPTNPKVPRRALASARAVLGLVMLCGIAELASAQVTVCDEEYECEHATIQGQATCSFGFACFGATFPGQATCSIAAACYGATFLGQATCSSEFACEMASFQGQGTCSFEWACKKATIQGQATCSVDYACWQATVQSGGSIYCETSNACLDVTVEAGGCCSGVGCPAGVEACEDTGATGASGDTGATGASGGACVNWEFHRDAGSTRFAKCTGDCYEYNTSTNKWEYVSRDDLGIWATEEINSAKDLRAGSGDGFNLTEDEACYHSGSSTRCYPWCCKCAE